MMTRTLSLACVAVFVVVGGAAAAQKATVYRWTDANGGVHYGDTPPQGRQAAQVRVDGSRAGTPPAAASAEATDAASKAPSTLDKAESTARARNCESARANMRTLDSKGILVDATDPAEPRRLSDVELATQRRTAQADIDTYCGGAGP